MRWEPALLQPSTSAPSVPLSACWPTVRGQGSQSARTHVQRTLHCQAQRSTVAHREPAKLASSLPCLAQARQAVDGPNHCARLGRDANRCKLHGWQHRAPGDHHDSGVLLPPSRPGIKGIESPPARGRAVHSSSCRFDDEADVDVGEFDAVTPSGGAGHEGGDDLRIGLKLFVYKGAASSSLEVDMKG